MKHFFRTLETVRHLTPVQITNRIKRRIVPLGCFSIPSGPVQLVGRKPVPPTGCADAGFDGRSFGFLNKRIPFEGPCRWNPPDAERLWTYTLHYFHYLWDLEPRQALALMLDWINENPVAQGPGWEPYPLSLRIREWIEWLQKEDHLESEVREAVLNSLSFQVEALSRQVEYHLQGNHLLENAITLCWAGLSLVTPQREAWVAKGKELLVREVDRQVLADGTHQERSPMYQALLAESLCRLAQVAASSNHPKGEFLEDVAFRAGRTLLLSLRHFVHPDGDYALLNDCAFAIAPRFDALCRRWLSPEETSPTGPWLLPTAGYFGWRSSSGEYLIFDAGGIGPDHQPGHGHADSLSFEMSATGQRIFTDTGVFTYSEGPLRSYDRSTAAHNTVEIDGKDQSDLWAAFRCGRRVKPIEGVLLERDDVRTLRGAYRGPGQFLRLVFHRRTVKARVGLLSFTDELVSRGEHDAILRLHVAPGLKAEKSGESVVLRDGPCAVARVAGDGLAWEVGVSPYHPEFGREQERACLSASFSFRNQARAHWQVETFGGRA